MTFQPSFTQGIFLNPSYIFPDDYKQFQNTIRDLHFDVATCVNYREIAFYPLYEVPIGNQFFTNNPQVYRSGFRKTFSESAITVFPYRIKHEITDVTLFTRIYGTADATGQSLPLPYSGVAANSNIELYIDTATNEIVIDKGAAAPNLTNVLIVVEFLKTSA